MFDQELDMRHTWLEEAYRDAHDQNPLAIPPQRVLIVRTSCRRRKGHKRAGTRRL